MTNHRSTMRYCLALDLVDDAELIAAYERWHAPGGVWPEITADVRARGGEHMEIWRIGTRMVMILEADEGFFTPRELPSRVTEWEALMSQYQVPVPGAAPGEKWRPMKRIYSLAEQGREAPEPASGDEGVDER